MRITETRMMELSGEAISKQRERVADAGQELGSGVRVNKPSDDLAAWTAGARARARAEMNDARGDAIGRGRDNLLDTDRVLDSIVGVLSRAKELGIQLANGTYDATTRAAAVAEVNSLRATALASANATGPDGEYLLAGTSSSVAPFTPAGAYVGDTVRRELEAGEGGERLVANVPGDVLTASSGVDVFATLDALAAALASNDVPGIVASLDGFGDAIEQVVNARTEVGERVLALDRADEARGSLELALVRMHDREVMADPVTAASELAQAQQAFEASRTVAQQLIQMFRRG